MIPRIEILEKFARLNGHSPQCKEEWDGLNGLSGISCKFQLHYGTARIGFSEFKILVEELGVSFGDMILYIRPSNVEIFVYD